MTAFTVLLVRLYRCKGGLSIMAYPAELPLPDLFLGDLGLTRLHAELDLEMAYPAGIFGTVAPVGKDDLLLTIFL